MIKVSVVVPVYNVRQYLEECIDSILGQSIKDIEVLCGDGGSDDGSLEILQDYATRDARIKIISKKGSGYGQSVNDCMNMAVGEYIGIVESDDVVKPDMYEKLYSIAKRENLDWVRGDIYYYYSQLPTSEQLVRESIIYGRDYYDTVWNPQTDYEPYKSGMRTWSGIYKRDFLNRHQIRHNETPGGAFQDVGFYLKTLYYATRVSFVNEAFYMWRQDNPGSSIHYDSKKLIEKSLNEWHLNYKYLQDHPELGRRAYGSYRYRQFFSYLWTIDMAKGEDKNYVRRVASGEFRKAFQRGEIEKGFFESWDWDKLMMSLEEWERLMPQSMLKQKIKSIFRPLADLARKITFKLMRDVLQRVEETERHVENTEQKILEQEDILWKIASRVEDINRRVENTEQKVLDQGNILWKIASRTEDINGRVENTEQKVLDQGNILWKIASRTEDINGRVENTEQKVLDQGDILWRVRSRLEDTFITQRDSAHALLWNMQYEFGRERMQRVAASSPLYDVVFYLNNRFGSVISAQHILPSIFTEYSHDSVVDFGCGTGTWLWVAQALGASKIKGLDGEYVPSELLMIPRDCFQGCDLQQRIMLPEKYDIAMSLEVAEHLSPEAADVYIQNIADSSDVVIFSAAHPGQGGDGHINEQPKDYWIEKFAAHGFRMIDISSRYADDERIMFWYRDNIMLFVRFIN